MSDKSNPSDTEQYLEDFDVECIEQLVAGELTTETLVGDGTFAKLVFGSLRERVRPQSALTEIDARVAKRAATKEAPNGPEPDREELH